MEGPELMLEQSLINDTALDLMLLIIGQGEDINATLLRLEYCWDLLLFGHADIIVSSSNFFPEGFD